MQEDAVVVARRAYQMAFTAVLLAVVAVAVAGAALLDSEWGGHWISRLSGDRGGHGLAIWRPGDTRPTYVEHYGE